MKTKENINWGWILTFTMLIFSIVLLAGIRQSEVEVKQKQKTIDSLNNEILILEEQIEMRERETDLLMDLTHDDFDKEVEVDKIERMLEEY